MADEIVFREGFDFYSGAGTTVGIACKWTLGGLSNTTTVVAGRFGGQAAKFDGGTGAGVSNNRSFDSAVGPYLTVGFAGRYDVALSRAGGRSHVRFGGMYFRFETSGAVSVGTYVAGSPETRTQLAVSAAGFVIEDVWNYFEIEAYIHDTDGFIRVYLEGNDTPIIEVVNVDTKSGAGNTASNISFGANGYNGSAQTISIDDVYVKDGATRLGPQKIESIRIAGNGAHQDSVPSTGTDRAAMLDETVASTSDSVSFSNVGEYDEYSLVDLVADPYSISEINVVAWMTKSDVAARAMSLGVDSGGTISDSADYFLSSSYSRFDRPIPLNPDGDVPWDRDSVNALIFRPKVTV